MRLFVVRHYKTVNNARKLIIGWGDSPAAEGWESDLVAVGRVLEETDVAFDCIYTSELKRAKVTGEFFGRNLGIEKVLSTNALNEVNYGSLYSKSKKWVTTNIPEYKTDPDFVFPKGESFTQMQARTVRFVQKLTRKHAAQNVLLVVHAGVIRGLICHFLRLPYAPNLKRHISHRYVGLFEFADGLCWRYDEQGAPSSFVTDGVVSIPWKLESTRARTS